MTSVVNHQFRGFGSESAMLDTDFDEPETYIAWLRDRAYEGHLGNVIVPDIATWIAGPSQNPPLYRWDEHQPKPHPNFERSPPPPRNRSPLPRSPTRHIEAAAQFRALGMEEEARIAERLEQDRIALER